MSGLDAISTLATIITIIDASVRVFDRVQKDVKLPEAFQIIGSRLPIILHTLQTCEENFKSGRDSMTPANYNALTKVVDDCDQKAQMLNNIFQQVIPGEDDTKEERYLKIVKRFGKGNKVEKIMQLMTKDVQLLVDHHLVMSSKPELSGELEKIVKEMDALISAESKREHSTTTLNNEGGPQIMGGVYHDHAQQIIGGVSYGGGPQITTGTYNAGKSSP